MRHPILTTILALATVQGFAQDIEGCYSYRIGEKVEKQTVEIHNVSRERGSRGRGN